MNPLAYLGTGVAVFAGLWFLYGRTGVDRQGLRVLWGRWLTGGDIILVPLFCLVITLCWPLLALLSLLWWAGDYFHLKSKERSLREKAKAQKQTNQYSHLSMDELMTAQKKALDELHRQK